MRAFCLVLGLVVLHGTTTQADSDVGEYWEAAYAGGQKIGYFHAQLDRVDQKGQIVLRTKQSSRLNIKRFDTRMSVSEEITAFETQAGRLYAMRSTMKAAQQEVTCEGILRKDGKFHIQVKTHGQTTEQTIAWPEDVVGPFAYARLLRDPRLTRGETIRYRTFVPHLNVLAEGRLVPQPKAVTTLRDGSKQTLLPVRMSLTMTGQPAPLPDATVWISDTGEGMKQEMNIGGVEVTTYPVSRSEALEQPSGSGVDLGLETLVAVTEEIPDAHGSASITYRLHFSDATAAAAIRSSSYQRVTQKGGNTMELVVKRTTPPAESPRQQGKSPGEEFLESNGFIQANDPLIRDAARQVVGGETDPWKKAQKLEKWVDENMSNANFSVGFASASEVIRTKTGDCTEHAVLLAALCRAEGIPSRVAMGLVYAQGRKAFAYHMWTEVWIGGEWYPLDGTLGKGSIGGGHIKIDDSSLKGVSAMSTLLPIFSVMGKLRIETLRVDR